MVFINFYEDYVATWSSLEMIHTGIDLNNGKDMIYYNDLP